MVVSQGKLGQILFIAVAVGFILGAVYDAVRLRRLVSESDNGKGADRALGKRLEYALIFAEDLLFAFICSVVLCIFIYYTNSGRFRGVIPAGAFIGFVIYRKTLGKLIAPLLVRIVFVLVWILKKIVRVLFVPIIGLLKWCFRRTFGLLIGITLTGFNERRALRMAENGFGITKDKGKIDNEKEFKHILKSGRRGNTVVLHGDYNKNAI